jgi:DNA repair exonuclease SbcCD ATPase subunit
MQRYTGKCPACEGDIEFNCDGVNCASLDEKEERIRHIETVFCEQNAVLESLADILDGREVSDFMLSFPVVRHMADQWAEIKNKEAELAEIIGWSREQCKQTGDSPMDAARLLIQQIAELKASRCDTCPVHPTTDATQQIEELKAKCRRDDEINATLLNENAELKAEVEKLRGEKP